MYRFYGISGMTLVALLFGCSDEADIAQAPNDMGTFRDMGVTPHRVHRVASYSCGERQQWWAAQSPNQEQPGRREGHLLQLSLPHMAGASHSIA